MGGGGKTIAAPVSGRPSRGGDDGGAPPQPRRTIRHRRALASALARRRRRLRLSRLAHLLASAAGCACRKTDDEGAADLTLWKMLC